MSQGPLCPNLSQKVQKEVSQIANRNFPLVMLLGGLSVNLNHLKIVVYIPIGIATRNIGPSMMKLKPDKYGVLYSTMSFLL